MILYKKQIIRIFTDLENLKQHNGIWYSGIKGEGKYNYWYSNGQLRLDVEYSNGKRKLWKR